MTTYNNFPSNSGGLGLPGAGFASRGKANGIKRLNLASPPKIGSISEDPSAEPVPTPRTSRSHLLAGLRTAPRTPGAVPASAPYNKTNHSIPGYNAARYAQPAANTSFGNVPHTAIGANFPSLGHQQQYGFTPGQQVYTLPEQVLAPPSFELDVVDEHQLDPQAASIYAHGLYLTERTRQLQQQIQQFSALSLNGPISKPVHAGYPQTPVTPQIAMYNQQLLQNSMAHIITQEVPGQPGMYVVHNTLTGQSTFAVDQAYQQQVELANSPPPPTPSRIATNFPVDYRNEAGSPFDNGSPFGARSRSPPKKTSSPAQNIDVTPLPPPSANAFRRGQHARNKSSLVLNSTNAQVADGPRSSRPAGIPATPMTGTFGPGQNRAGEHAMRQPYNPPSIDELKSKPTTKHEGSKNFATRQRRRALHKLVRAGFERRNVARPGSGSAGSMTPVSDTELTFSIPSDNDSDSGNNSLHKASFSNLRGLARPIGSERQQSKESIKSN